MATRLEWKHWPETDEFFERYQSAAGIAEKRGDSTWEGIINAPDGQKCLPNSYGSAAGCKAAIAREWKYCTNRAGGGQ